MKSPELKIFTGPMFGGKTTRMLAALERYRYQNKTTILFKPNIDDRYSDSKVVTHKGQEYTSILVKSGEEILEQGALHDVVGVDEMFLIPGSAECLISLYKQGKTVLVSSLQLSSTSAFLQKGYEPFDEMVKLMPWATHIEVCPAICYKCDRDAYYTERLCKEEKKFLIGGAESYQPVCYKHSVMGKSSPKN
jgi:thymidine kinase